MSDSSQSSKRFLLPVGLLVIGMTSCAISIRSVFDFSPTGGGGSLFPALGFFGSCLLQLIAVGWLWTTAYLGLRVTPQSGGTFPRLAFRILVACAFFWCLVTLTKL